MESLYVCLFSNGHIKVGRSIDPQARVAAHADRVACMGVKLIEYRAFVVGEAQRRESMLIALCTAAPGAVRFQNEWFAGLTFHEVCDWACQIASRELAPVFSGGHLREYLSMHGGMSVSQLREAMNVLGADLKDDAQIRQWVAVDAEGNFKRQPGAAYAMCLERATNGLVTRKAMRPGDAHLIWPELVA